MIKTDGCDVRHLKIEVKSDNLPKYKAITSHSALLVWTEGTKLSSLLNSVCQYFSMSWSELLFLTDSTSRSSIFKLFLFGGLCSDKASFSHRLLSLSDREGSTNVEF